MSRVTIESPYAGDVELNLKYLRACMHDSLMRGEAPYASHGLYTQLGVLDDSIVEERARGIRAGYAWMRSASFVALYTDLGESTGMLAAIQMAKDIGVPIVKRQLGPEWEKEQDEREANHRARQA